MTSERELKMKFAIEIIKSFVIGAASAFLIITIPMGLFFASLKMTIYLFGNTPQGIGAFYIIITSFAAGIMAVLYRDYY